MSVELKPCPFCGQPAKHEVWSLQNYHRVWCGNCDVEMDYFCSLEDAAMRWNTRAPQWMTIDSAPRDGCVWAFNGEQGAMKWSEGDGWALWVWADELLSDVDPSPQQPTHWQPLPAPPEVNS